MARRGAKYRKGQWVYDKDDQQPVKILRRGFDSWDGWLYDVDDRIGECLALRFESQLRPLTSREKGERK